MSAYSTFLSRRASRRAALTAAVPLLLAACAPNATPTPALATATPSGSAVAGRFTLATFTAATLTPPTATAVPPTPPRTAPAGTGATATPRPAGTAVVVTASVPVRGTNAPAPTTGPAGTLATYADPAGGIRLQYPANWRATLPTAASDRDLTLESPGTNGLLFSLIILEAPAGTPLPPLDEVAQDIRDTQMSSRQFVYTAEMLKDATVAGERGKTFDYTFVEQANRTAAPRRGTYWLIPRDARIYVFQASNIEASRADVDAILNSVMFATPRPATAAPTRSALPASRTTGAPTTPPLPTRAAGTASAVTR